MDILEYEGHKVDLSKLSKLAEHTVYDFIESENLYVRAEYYATPKKSVIEVRNELTPEEYARGSKPKRYIQIVAREQLKFVCYAIYVYLNYGHGGQLYERMKTKFFWTKEQYEREGETAYVSQPRKRMRLA
jgi:hypothetical protein